VLKITRFSVVLAFVGAICWGQSQVATVSSPSAFTLRGVAVNPGQGVPSWPALSGDTIKAGKSPVTLSFPDGSTITLNPGAEASVELSHDQPVFRLKKGTCQYALKTLTSVHVISGSQTVALTTLAGTLGKVGAGALTAGQAAIGIAVAGAAAGLGVGVAEATSGGSSVSPSH
jgi:hypothetical protein